MISPVRPASSREAAPATRPSIDAPTQRRLGRALLISAKSGAAPAPRPAQASASRLVLDRRPLPGGADRDLRDVRRAAAASQDRHRERQPERGVLPLRQAI